MMCTSNAYHEHSAPSQSYGDFTAVDELAGNRHSSVLVTFTFWSHVSVPVILWSVATDEARQVCAQSLVLSCDMEWDLNATVLVSRVSLSSRMSGCSRLAL